MESGEPPHFPLSTLYSTQENGTICEEFTDCFDSMDDIRNTGIFDCIGPARDFVPLRKVLGVRSKRAVGVRSLGTGFFEREKPQPPVV